MSLLTNPYVLIPTLSLLIQIVVLALLVYGYWLKKRLVFQKHGLIMEWAVALHLIAIFAIMVPSFVLAVIPEYVGRHFFWVVSIIALVHVPLGIAAASLGVWFVVGWRIQGLKGCFNRKRKMLATMIIWLTSISFGFVLYTIFYWSALMG
jgi:hypothetical protein